MQVTPESVQRFKEFWEEHAERPLVGRDKILAMICPQLHGMSLVKLAVAMLLVGGAPQWASPGVHARSDIHLLLVGDPGIGESFHQVHPSPSPVPVSRLSCNLNMWPADCIRKQDKAEPEQHRLLGAPLLSAAWGDTGCCHYQTLFMSNNL